MGAYSKLVSELFDFEKLYEDPIVEDYIVGFSGISPSKKVDPASIGHESLGGLLGGNTSEHYHLTSRQVSQIQTNANNISTLNTSVNTLNANVSTLSAKQSVTEQELSKVAAQVTSLNSSVSALNVNVATLTTKQSTTERELSKVAEQVNSLNENVNILYEQFDQLTDTILRYVQEKVDSLQEQINSLARTSINNSIEHFGQKHFIGE